MYCEIQGPLLDAEDVSPKNKKKKKKNVSKLTSDLLPGHRMRTESRLSGEKRAELVQRRNGKTRCRGCAFLSVPPSVQGVRLERVDVFLLRGNRMLGML